MPLIYTLISRGSDVLTEATKENSSGNFAAVTRALLQRLENKDGSISYVENEYVFHVLQHNNLVYLCMSDRQFDRDLAYEFMEEVRAKFVSMYGARAQTAIAFSLDADFNYILLQLMQHYNNMQGADRLHVIQDKFGQVNDIMVKNIEMVLERGEGIDLLVEKSDILDQHAFKFEKSSTRMRRRMWYKNAKWWALIFVVFVAVLYIILASACGGMELKDC